jgi:hypothetical protein
MEKVKRLAEHLREHSARVAGGTSGENNFDPETLALESDAAEVIERLHEWGTMSASEMRLRGGEMTAQEIRTVKAVLNSIGANAYSSF